MKPTIDLVLVRPIYPSNIGFCARACANLGANRLVIIDPQCNLDDLDAKRRAAGAQEAFSNKVTYSSWKNFLENDGEGLKIAFTRRGGKNRPVPIFNELLLHINKNIPEDSKKNIFLILGPEDDGLNAEDLMHTNLYAQLPVYGEMGSYNLGHAAILSLYIIKNFYNFSTVEDLAAAPISQNQNKEARYDLNILQTWLEQLGLDVSHPTKSTASIINNMILRSCPTYREVDVWNKVLQNTIRLLKKLKPEDKWQKHTSK